MHDVECKLLIVGLYQPGCLRCTFRSVKYPGFKCSRIAQYDDSALAKRKSNCNRSVRRWHDSNRHVVGWRCNEASAKVNDGAPLPWAML
jgi:hypothetical protein